MALEEQEIKGREPNGWSRLIPVGVAVVLIMVILAVMALGHKKGEEGGKPEESGIIQIPDSSPESAGGNGEQNRGDNNADNSGENIGDSEEKDPQNPAGQELGSQVDVAQLLVSQRVQEEQRITVGIDVSRYQGTIDWSQEEKDKGPGTISVSGSFDC